MVGDGWALTRILGCGNEIQWQSRSDLRAFAKQKVLTQLKGRFPPRRMEKWNNPCLLNLSFNFTVTKLLNIFINEKLQPPSVLATVALPEHYIIIIFIEWMDEKTNFTGCKVNYLRQ